MEDLTIEQTDFYLEVGEGFPFGKAYQDYIPYSLIFFFCFEKWRWN